MAKKETIKPIVNEAERNRRIEPVEGNLKHEFTEQQIKDRAKDIYARRLRGDEFYEHGEIDNMLRRQGIDPGTNEAKEFMAKWDWHKAIEELKKENEVGEAPKPTEPETPAPSGPEAAAPGSDVTVPAGPEVPPTPETAPTPEPGTPAGKPEAAAKSELKGLIEKELKGLEEELKSARVAYLEAEKAQRRSSRELGRWARIRRIFRRDFSHEECSEEQNRIDREKLAAALERYNKAIQARADFLYNLMKAGIDGRTDLTDEQKRRYLRHDVLRDIYKGTLLREDMALNKSRSDSFTDHSEERKWYHNWLSRFGSMPRGRRFLLSLGMATGAAFIFNPAFATASILGIATVKAFRIGAGMLVGSAAGRFGDRFVDWRHRGRQENILFEGRRNIIEAGDDEAFRNLLREQLAVGNRRMIENYDRRHRENVIKNFAVVGIAGLTALGMGVYEKDIVGWLQGKSSIFGAAPGGAAAIIEKAGPIRAPGAAGASPPGASAEWALSGKIPPTHYNMIDLTIGKRGPEGAIIDYFREHYDIAKQWGWDGKGSIDNWAGTKAHKLWLDLANNELSKPETLAELKKLGYTADIDGYAQMMRRIGKGTVNLLDAEQKIGFADMHYLKAAPIEYSPDSAAASVGNQGYNLFEQYGYDNIPVSPGRVEDIVAPAPPGETVGEAGDLADASKKAGQEVLNANMLDAPLSAREVLDKIDKLGISREYFRQVRDITYGDFVGSITDPYSMDPNQGKLWKSIHNFFIDKGIDSGLHQSKKIGEIFELFGRQL